MSKKILIDTLYINSGGGRSILFEIINYLRLNNKLMDFYFLFDNRLLIETSSLDEINHEFLSPSLINRKNFYKQNIRKYRSLVCLANIPAPINVEIPVFIYFHNVLLLEPFNRFQNFNIQLSNFFKKKYIKFKKKSSYKWIVQTDLMKSKLKSKLKINDENIQIMPIFNNTKSQNNLKSKRSFLYISNYSSHKNFERLINSFVIYGNEHNESLEINFTLDSISFEKLLKNKKVPQTINFINHGEISYHKVNNLYKKIKFLIFPSLNESFGLPLIEAVNHECKIIAPNLPYVNQVLIPTLNFDPYSTSSIVSSIKEATGNLNLKPSKIIIENKIDTFVKYIYENI